MPLLSTLIVSGDATIGSAVRASGLAEPVLELELAAPDVGAEEIQVLRSHEADLLILDIGDEADLGIKLADFLTREKVSRHLIVVGPTPSTELLLDAIRAGVTEYLPKPIDPADLANALKRVSARSTEILDRSAPQAGSVLAVIGAGGGTGATTLATNLAIDLHNLTGNSVLLTDFDVGLGDAELHLGVDPRFSVCDLLENLPRIDDRLLASLVEQHESGIHFLRSPADPEAADIESDRVRDSLRYLRRQYAIVIVDAPNPFAPHAAALLAEADQILVVATPEISPLRNLQRVLSAVESAGGKRERVRLIVNQYDSGALPLGEIARVTGVEILGRISLIPAVSRSIAEGHPLASSGGGAVRRELRELTLRLAETIAPEQTVHKPNGRRWAGIIHRLRGGKPAPALNG